MKGTTQNILNWFNNPTIENQLKQFKQNNPNFTDGETSIEEAFSDLEYSKQILLALIEKDILDKATFTKRNQILSHLNQLTNYLNQIQRFNFALTHPQSRPQANAIISSTQALRDIIDSGNLVQKLDGYYSYVAETKELIKIKKRFSDLVRDIENAEKQNKETIALYEIVTNSLKELNEKAKLLETSTASTLNLKKQIEQLYNQITNNAQDIESKKITINSIHASAKELQNIIENADIKVSEILKSSEVKSTSFISEETVKFGALLKDYESKTNGIVDKNIDLQGKINQLLEGANAGRLYKSFHWRKRQLEKGLWFWFASIITVNVLIVLLTLLIVNGSASLGIDKLNAASIDGAFFVKLFISIPLIFLDYFFISQYNQRRILIEKYTFKSALSLSLLAYNEMIKEHADIQESKEFISKSVEKIFESPFDSEKLSKRELDILNKLAGKGLEHLDNVTKNAVNRMTS